MRKRRRKAAFNKHFSLSAWLARHAQVFLSSLGRLARRPLGSLMTLTVLGIAISLPLGLHLLVNNLQQLAGNWDGSASISLFLEDGISEEQAEALMDTLKTRPDIGAVQHITPEQAMAEFRQHSGFGDALDLLDSNPLPHVLLVQPANPDLHTQRIKPLLDHLKAQPGVELALADLQWVERFQGINRMLERIALLLALLLALAVLLIIGNTIRLEIQSRRDEIEIVKLVGGSNSFIRRPFLYEGFWYGLLGGLLATLLIWLASLALRGPAQHLADLYHSNFHLGGLDLHTAALVLGMSVLLGIAGAWTAVSQHLRDIEPSD
ncbi:permease-like cell division protein FtsX [Thiolapillus brandeum]|uniref:Cell division protein FtsX n=1 Tax=Thiolapillus brandeum TaxID=1076588 RepID=A0A7U6GJX8_9GAMM|nr:permease-like cell division protein FtsX [Thiolapillus brandeum]BAO44960.1 cell division transporter permease protein [Thiolapillus brandeum]